MTTRQLDFQSSGIILSDAVFVVVDCETTGLSPKENAITEIAAIKIQGGKELGNFQTLINPKQQLPARIAALTGITNEELQNCPTIDEILPTFLEFLGSNIIVGHNIKFDLGFINASLERCGYDRLTNTHLDTLSLARKLIAKEVRDFKLSTLARYCKAEVSPTHRAFADVKATIDVFHHLVGKSSSLGVTGLNDLVNIPSIQKRTRFLKRDLAKDAPKKPGVYMFVSKDEEILYVGKSQNINQRLGSYFISDDRSRISRMISKSHSIEYITTATAFEARIAELRLLQTISPESNVADTRLSRMNYVVANTNESAPAFRVKTGTFKENNLIYGPFTSKSAAYTFKDAISYALKTRNCDMACCPGKKVSNSECITSLRGYHSCFCRDKWDSIDEYIKRFNNASNNFTPEYTKYTMEILKEMKTLSRNLQFEKAQTLHTYAISIQKWMNRFAVITKGSQTSVEESEASPQIVSGRPIVRWQTNKESRALLLATKIIQKENDSIAGTTITSDNLNGLFICEARDFKERYYAANFLAKNNFFNIALQK